MKKLLLAILCLISLKCGAQAVSLPYHSGFDNTDQRKGWVEMRMGYHHDLHWGLNGFMYYSSPYSLYHDYPVEGQAQDTVDDWYVSPAIKIGKDAKLEFKFNLYSITGSVTASDYFGIWFSSGSSNPANKQYVELANITSLAGSDFNQWLDTVLRLPDNVDSGYIAFRYKATQNWFTVNVDDVNVTGPASSIGKTVQAEPVLLYPNPLRSSQELTMNIGSELHNAVVTVYDIGGRQVKKVSNINGNMLRISCRSLDKGAYTFQLADEKGYSARGKFIID